MVVSEALDTFAVVGIGPSMPWHDFFDRELVDKVEGGPVEARAMYRSPCRHATESMTGLQVISSSSTSPEKSIPSARLNRQTETLAVSRSMNDLQLKVVKHEDSPVFQW